MLHDLSNSPVQLRMYRHIYTNGYMHLYREYRLSLSFCLGIRQVHSSICESGLDVQKMMCLDKYLAHGRYTFIVICQLFTLFHLAVRIRKNNLRSVCLPDDNIQL